jgi:hypothetical protein
MKMANREIMKEAKSASIGWRLTRGFSCGLLAIFTLPGYQGAVENHLFCTSRYITGGNLLHQLMFLSGLH